MSSSSPEIKPFIITVSSRALFDLEESHKIFQEQGMGAFVKHQLEHEDDLLAPGPAFGLVKKLCEINKKLPPGARPVEVILLSRNSPETGLRVFNTIEKMGLPIERAVFTSGRPTSTYIDAIGAQLFLSSNPIEVGKALNAGIGAANLVAPRKALDASTNERVHIAFDGDAVLFSDEAERVHYSGQLPAFHRHEVEHAHRPLPPGPMKPFLDFIHQIQELFPNPDECPIRTALVTARAAPAHKRAILTLRDWGIRVDEGMFLGGRAKAPFLKAFGADLFLDDSQQNIENAMDHVPSGHVPSGIRNEVGNEHGFTGTTPPVADPVASEAGKRRTAPRPR